MTTTARQHGGTLLGLIIGVVAGLAVALVVAVYVTRVPVPFIDKNASRMPLQNAAEAERNRDWDPNAGLQSRPEAQPGAAGAATGGLPAPGSLATLVPAEVAPPAAGGSAPFDNLAGGAVQTRPVEPGGRVSVDPLGDLIASRTPAPAPAVRGGPPAADPFVYYVQAGAFHDAQDAEQQRMRLSMLGVESRVTAREQSGRTVYRVRSGPYATLDAARQVEAELGANGQDAALVRVQR